MSKKKAFPLLTAAQAREYVAAPDPTGVYTKIDYAVKKAVADGRDVIDLSTIIPQPHSGAWAAGKMNDYVNEVAMTLLEAGYSIETHAGNQAVRGYIRLTWPEKVAADA